MASSIQPVAGTGQFSAAATPSASPAPVKQDLGKDTFLKLLVAQLKNQNPMNPADGMQFLGQLAQFSQLEQTMEIRKDLDAIRTALSATPGDSKTGAGAASGKP